ncbi:MAG TPA: zinc ribbon domain-containing protein [Pyrinomonadaceae bacterium]|nr:zinc ribbon domain-containing protein [Pyrinomonadaceae bacterium]
MYCANCGTQLVQGLSYCNRCGSNLRERTESNTGAISAFLTAITTFGVAGLFVMLFGAIVLRRKANMDQEFIGVFLTFTFLLVGLIEFMLIRNLAKLMAPKESQIRSFQPPVTNDLRLPQHSTLGEPVPSVTENTTRTLEYATREHGRT